MNWFVFRRKVLRFCFVYIISANTVVILINCFICNGYMSPEYAMSGIFLVKSDVYSFGFLLLEIATGKKKTIATFTLIELVSLQFYLISVSMLRYIFIYALQHLSWTLFYAPNYLMQEFMGRNLLVMNVMWKYMEQVCLTCNQ